MGKIDTRLEEKLEYLSKISDTDYPFISLYLNVNAQEYFDQNRINAIFMKNSFRDSTNLIKEKDLDKYNSFESDKRRITDFLQNELETWAHGVAIFACDKLGVFQTFQSIMPFDNSFVVDSFPHLKQFAYQADEFENALAVMIDSRYATIYNIKLGGFIQNMIESEHLFHRYHKEGGWAQANFQRHIKDQREEHFREVAKIASDFIDKENYDNVILIGQEHEIQNFRSLLPKRVDYRVIDINTLQRRENKNNFLEAIVHDLNKREHQKEESTVQNLIDRTYMSDSSTMGIQDTLDSAQSGSIRILTVAKDINLEGFKCGDCLYISEDQHKAGCPECNGNLKRTDLVEEVIRLTLKNRGSVEIVEDRAAEELNKHEGIGAYLRY